MTHRRELRPLSILVTVAVAFVAHGNAHAQSAPSGVDAPAPALQVVGTNAAGELRLRATTSPVAGTVAIESIAGPDVDVEVRMTPLRDARGGAHAAAIARPGQPAAAAVTVHVASLRSVALEFTAALPELGEYTGELVLVYGQPSAAARTPVIVTRALDDLGVEVLGLEPVAGDADVFGVSQGVLQLTLHETAGRALTLDPPVLTRLSEKAVARAHELRVESTARGDDGRLTLGPNAIVEVTMTLGQLDGAGVFRGSLRLTAPGHTPVDRDVAVSLREPWWSALGFALVGVLASTLLAIMSTSLRARLVARRRVLLVARELDELIAAADRDEAERQVLRAVRRELTAVLADIDRKVMTGITARIERVERKRALATAWMAAGRRIRTLRRPALRGQLAPAVDAARAVLVDPEASADAVTAQRAQMLAIGGEIDKKLTDELTARIQQLRDELQAWVTQPASPLTTSALQTMQPLLAEATRALEAHNLPGADAEYERARTVWTGVLIDGLALAVEGPQPSELEAEAWTRLVGQVRAELTAARAQLDADPDGAVAGYRRAYAAYVATRADAVEREARRLTAAARDLNEKERAEVAKDLAQAIEQAGAARGNVAVGRTGDAARAFDSARAALERARAPVASAQRNLDLAEAVVAARSSEIPDRVGAVTTSEVDPETSLRGIASVITLIDATALVAAVAVAGLLAVKGLWIPNPTWGGFGDHLEAILWGLGLHQFTYAGIDGLSRRTSSASPEGAT